MPHLHTVYNTLNNPPSRISLIMGYVFLTLFVCLFILIGLKLKDLKITLNGGLKVSPFFALIPPVVIFASFYLSTEKLIINVYEHDQRLLKTKSNELKTVEGRVANYSQESEEGHGYETFTVNGIEFHYSHFEEGRSGYHQTSRYGGAMKPNLYVRILYYFDGDRNAILKLQTE